MPQFMIKKNRILTTTSNQEKFKEAAMSSLDETWMGVGGVVSEIEKVKEAPCWLPVWATEWQVEGAGLSLFVCLWAQANASRALGRGVHLFYSCPDR